LEWWFLAMLRALTLTGVPMADFGVFVESPPLFLVWAVYGIEQGKNQKVERETD
jgi:hypothetical protein